jgi:hypothetical protein
MTLWWGFAGGMASVALGAGFAERRRKARVDLDRIGLVDWAGVQLLAVAGAIIAISGALHA